MRPRARLPMPRASASRNATSEELSDAAHAALVAEHDRALNAFTGFVSRWPQFRKHAALALLGAAVATVDTVGGDAEAFVASLRAHEPKAPPLLEGEPVFRTVKS